MSGSEKRQRTKLVSFRCTLEEKRRLEETATLYGMSLGALVRAHLRDAGVLK